MSADNWAICPRCRRTAEAEHNEAFQRAVDAYGKVTAEEYEQLRVEASKPVELESEMREDYELGVEENGRFHISYEASCQSCGFKYAYRYEEELDVA